jgi:malonyl-CoA/methylmalonyl-CoA synthetase
MSEISNGNHAEPRGHFLEELLATVTARSGAPALLYKGECLTYGELDTRARNAAGTLRRQGVEPGDRVAIITPEKLPFLAAHLGVLQTGAISLPLNPRFTREELRYFLEDSAARVAVVGHEQRALVDSLRHDLSELSTVLADGELWNSPRNTFAERAVKPTDPCLMIYSSGTTGRPKGVLHTHANLAASLRALQTTWRFTPDDVVVNVLPLFHVHGLSFGAQLSLLTGCCMLVDDAFDTRRTLDAIGQGTVFLAVPPFYYRFLEEPAFREQARTWSRVRLFTCGSAPIRPEVLPDLEAILDRPVINRYGMTEAHVITSLPLDGPWPQGSVGIPLQGIELRLVQDGGKPCEPGEIGSVQICGPNLFHEYWRKPEATREAFAGGWFDTGDLGCHDASGFLTLVGRKHDLIITNSYNVYPQVVERVINDCPGVKESAVLGVPDKLCGERVVAAIVRSDESLTEQALRAYVSERLVHYQRPVDVVFVASLPRNAMGKVMRRELRGRFRQ